MDHHGLEDTDRLAVKAKQLTSQLKVLTRVIDFFHVTHKSAIRNLQINVFAYNTLTSSVTLALISIYDFSWIQHSSDVSTAVKKCRKVDPFSGASWEETHAVSVE